MADRHLIRPSIGADAEQFAPLMRAADVNEIKAASGHDPLDALHISIAASENSWAAFIEGEPLCIYGAARTSAISSRARIWMLGTELLEKHPMRFLKHSAAEIDKMSQSFTYLDNWCDARNKITVRWLKWLGFTIEPAAPYGVANMPFHHFYKAVK